MARKVVIEMVLGVMASSMGMVVVALEGCQPELYRRVMVAILVVPIGLDRKVGTPAVIALAVVGSQLVLDRKGMATVVHLGSVHMVAVVEAADS